VRPVVGQHGGPVATVDKAVLRRDRLYDAVHEQGSAAVILTDPYVHGESR
jgi:hypothetical protein